MVDAFLSLDADGRGLVLSQLNADSPWAALSFLRSRWGMGLEGGRGEWEEGGRGIVVGI